MVPVYLPSRLRRGMQENFLCSIFSSVWRKVSFSKMYATSLFGVKKNKMFTFVNTPLILIWQLQISGWDPEIFILASYGGSIWKMLLWL